MSAHPAPSLDDWLDQLAAGTAAPGGGGAAALAGALAAALVAMVARLTLGRKGYAGVSRRVEAILSEAEDARRDARALIDRDAAAYRAVMEAHALPKDAPGRPQALDRALRGAAAVPLELAHCAVRLIGPAAELATIGNKNARADARVAETLARAALAAALDNVRENVAALSDPEQGRAMLEAADRLAREAR